MRKEIAEDHLVFRKMARRSWHCMISRVTLSGRCRKAAVFVAAAISTFLTGFVVAKLDKLFELTIEKEVLSQVAFGQALIFGTAFLLGTLFTFIGRRYIP